VWNNPFDTTVISQTLNDGLVAYYPFNGNANDESGNGHNGTVNGATLVTDRKGNENSAYSFNGISNYIIVNNVNSTALQPNNELTISCFIYANPTTNSMSRIIRCAAKNGYILSWKQGNENSIQAIFGTLSNNCLDVTGVPNSSYTGAWYHLCVTYSKTTKILKLHINGILESLLSNCCYDFQYDTSLFTVGSSSTGYSTTEFFKGKIDDIRIFNRVLTEQEIKQLFKE
jgi:hypothetical protein